MLLGHNRMNYVKHILHFLKGFFWRPVAHLTQFHWAIGPIIARTTQKGCFRTINITS